MGFGYGSLGDVNDLGRFFFADCVACIVDPFISFVIHTPPTGQLIVRGNDIRRCAHPAVEATLPRNPHSINRFHVARSISQTVSVHLNSTQILSYLLRSCPISQIRSDPLRSFQIFSDSFRSSQRQQLSVRSPQILSEAFRSSQIPSEPLRASEIVSVPLRSSQFLSDPQYAPCTMHHLVSVSVWFVIGAPILTLSTAGCILSRM